MASLSSLRLMLLVIPLIFCQVVAQTPEAEKITPEQLIAKHLDSIAPAQKREAIHSRIISGTSFVEFLTVPKGQAAGRAVLASEPTKHLIGLSFNNPVYPKEGFGFNGNSFIAAFVTPGVRSSLGSFLMQHDLIFKQGLMGGTLSSAWVLQNLQGKTATLSYAGLKKIDKRMLHELKYSPRGSDLQISLYFDEATFQHVRTEYRRLIAAETGDRSYSNVTARESRYKLVEEFSDFKPEQGLTLPHKYKINFSADTQSGTFLAQWTLTLTTFTFNEKIDPAAYNFDENP